MDKLTEMLRIQRDLQGRMGHRFVEMTVPERIEYIKNMMLATQAELHEALDEVNWKSWGAVMRSDIKSIPFTAELSDAFQFIMNMWFAAFPHMTPEELAHTMLTVLQTKIDINDRRRITGVAEKCLNCSRALDDPAVECWRAHDHVYCAVNNTDYNLISTRPSTISQ